jgi:hypothetical protein
MALALLSLEQAFPRRRVVSAETADATVLVLASIESFEHEHAPKWWNC